MNEAPLDRYLSQVSRRLMGLAPKLREDVLLELRSHILSQAEEEGTDVEAVIEKMGSPGETARSYVQLYGYGTGMKALAAVAAGALAFLTLPFSLASPAFLGTAALSSTTLVLLIVVLILVGARVDRTAALAAGVTAGGVRFAALGIGVSQEVATLTEGAAILAYVVTSVVLVFVGYLAAPRRASST